MRRLTREQQRRRTKRILAACTYACLLALLLIWLIGYMVMDATANPDTPAPESPVTVSDADDGRIPGDDIPATQRCYLTPEEMEAAENEMIEAALLNRSKKIEDVTITFYCCEERPHICGTGTGITASGRRVTPYVSCAVDTSIIPLGSTIMIDYNGEMVYLRADDTGPAIKGNHIDIAVQEHQEALELGVKNTDIWWCEE